MLTPPKFTFFANQPKSVVHVCLLFYFASNTKHNTKTSSSLYALFHVYILCMFVSRAFCTLLGSKDTHSQILFRPFADTVSALFIPFSLHCKSLNYTSYTYMYVYEVQTYFIGVGPFCVVLVLLSHSSLLLQFFLRQFNRVIMSMKFISFVLYIQQLQPGKLNVYNAVKMFQCKK